MASIDAGVRLCLTAFSTHARNWRTRPIVLVIGFAGGTGDSIGRVFAEYAVKQLGQPVVVENRPGGGGVSAAVGLQKAPPDGTTIALQAVGPMILRPLMDSSVTYDADKDFTPIALFGDTPNVILGGAKFPARSVRETVAWALKNPGRLTTGHPGPGTMGHLAALLFASNAGITGTYISYRNVGQMGTDLLGGQIDVGVAAYTPQLAATRVLAVMTPERVAFLPEVPSMREAGFAGVYASTWFGLFGPPDMPSGIVEKLNSVVNAFARDDDVQKRVAALGFRVIGGPPGDLTKRIVEDKALWSKVVKDNNIKLDEQR
jgi:tripartite-type tricarboxylate transporter receptor subunit TctC